MSRPTFASLTHDVFDRRAHQRLALRLIDKFVVHIRLRQCDEFRRSRETTHVRRENSFVASFQKIISSALKLAGICLKRAAASMMGWIKAGATVGGTLVSVILATTSGGIFENSEMSGTISVG